MSREIIVRADDLGYSRGVNLGIADAVNHGLIRSVGIMTNMPETRSGYEMLEHPEKLCLGLHTNICVGRPLCSPEDIPSITDVDGNLKSSRIYRSTQEDFVVLDEVIQEIEAQYQAFVELTGRKPDYFEGHAVASDNFFKGLEIVAKRHGCDYLAFAMGQPVSFGQRKIMMEMNSMGPDYDPGESLKEMAQKDYGDNTIGCMVCHPGYLDAFILKTSSMTTPRTLEVEMAQDSEIVRWLQDRDIQLITFTDCK